MNFKKSLFILLAAIAVYFLMILHHGYELGRSDHAQAAYGFYLNDNSLFANDFYIQSLAHQTPNERTFYGYFISLAGKTLPFLSFVFHFIFSIILLLGIRKIASKFIQSEWVRWCKIPWNYDTLVLSIPDEQETRFYGAMTRIIRWRSADPHRPRRYRY